MFKTTMEVDAALGAVWHMPRGNLVNSLVRSFVRTCIRTAGQSQRVAAARAAARAVAARTTSASGSISARRVDARPAASPATPVVPRPATVVTRPRGAALASAPAAIPASAPAFARVSSRRDAQPATLNPVRIYSTPSRTIMVGNLSEVARFLDDSIERERARLATRIQAAGLRGGLQGGL